VSTASRSDLLARCTFPPVGTAVVCGVSGGADSLALLALAIEAGCQVTALHVDHGLRPASAAEAQVVAAACERFGASFRSVTVDVGAGPNLEARARNARLAALGDGALLGHTADDQAETVLHRLIRGTGLRGLRGIAPVRETILRPLLAIPRADLLDYLSALDQPFRTDSTNADTAFTRNRIRAELLPLLRTFNPAVVDVLGRLSVQAEELFAEQETETAELLRSVELPRAGEMLVLDADTLTALGEAKTRRVLRMLWDREGWSVNAMTFDHWRRAAMITTGEHPAADFPDGVHVRRAGRVVQLHRRG
jgi:tRNA(Ile)-lysidine synthase